MGEAEGVAQRERLRVCGGVGAALLSPGRMGREGFVVPEVA